MKIELREITENPDGSADCELNIDADGMKLLVQEGLIAVLWKAINLAKKEATEPEPIPFFNWLNWWKK
jgi:hypothetical protein